MKKLYSYVLILILLVSTMAGCSSEAGSSKSKEGTVEIEFWYGLGGKLGELVEKRIKEFNSSQDDVKVIGIAQADYDETPQKLQAAIASKKVPAAVLLQNDPMHAFAKKKALASLDEYIKADKDFNQDDFISAFYEQGKIDGKQFAIPLYGTTQVLYYHKDLFEKAGITEDSLKTWESLAEAAKQLKTNEVYGWEPMWGPDNMIDAALSRGAKYLSEDGKVVLIDSSEWVEAWDYFKKNIHDEKSMRIHHGGQGWEYWYKTIDDVMQGKAAGYTGSSGDQGDLDFNILAAHPQPGWEGHDAAPHAGAMVGAIPALASKEQQEAAYKWLKFFTSPDKTADWSVNTGYIPVRKSAQETQVYKDFAARNPQISVPLQQAQQATPPFVDPTGGKIYDALEKAADKVEIEGISAEKALKEAKKEAQRELDKVNK
ncbi:carbohydrate ABC transporter substrate-binding protein, CUT1 family [Bacillus sp. cl95]|nr:carbohydrate ABC transporter substrate-binding protein, CUT1 family [Bacillus sp. UNCCL13]SFQ88511.1 carbohydrate ABC transporter substrate-binding protein, CUT1 family [Bacillus sp. cl95]